MDPKALKQKYGTISRDVEENYINLNPLQRGGILTPEAQKVLLSFGDGYSMCDHCLKGRLDQVRKPPVEDFLVDLAKFLDIDATIPASAARDAKRIIVNVLSKKYPERKVAILDANAHYTTYLALEFNNVGVKEVPHLGAPQYEMDIEQYETKIDEVVDATGEPPLCAILTHVDYQYGNITNAKRVGEICKKTGVPFLLNGAYSLGVVPFSARDVQADFVVASGHKSMAASGPIGIIGMTHEFKDNIMETSSIKGDWSGRQFGVKPCNLMGCPPIYGAPLATLMASFPTVVERATEERFAEETKKIQYLLAEIERIESFQILGVRPKIHPLTNIRTPKFQEVSQTHSRKGFFVYEEFKKRGIVGMAPGVSKKFKISTYGLSWDQVKYVAKSFQDIAREYGISIN